MPEPIGAAAQGSPLFTFIVVADTHVNEAERMSTSPYETNHLSNPRTRHVFTEIVEAVFAGHVHNFWYDRPGDAEMYLLPSTSFQRHDFSQLCSVAPPAEDEFGRDDSAKCGWFRVDVHEEGHVAYAVRSHGRECAPDETPPAPRHRHLAHPKTSGFDNAA